MDLIQPAGLENLLRVLLDHLPVQSQIDVQATTDTPAEEVLLDLEVDGRRYLLVRLPRVQPSVQLSPREREIVRLVALGHPNKTIADVLSISSWTVCTHLRRIFAKLGVGSRAAMVAQLREIGSAAAVGWRDPKADPAAAGAPTKTADNRIKRGNNLRRVCV